MPFNYAYNEDNYIALETWKDKLIKNNNTLKEPLVISVGYTVAIHLKDSRFWTHDPAVEAMQTTMPNHTEYVTRIRAS